MSKVYLPTFTTSNCIVILNKDTIRVYENLPSANQVVNYTDFYINSHYLEKNSSELIDLVPICENQDNFTTDWVYRNDFPDILLIIFIVSIIGFYLPYKIFSRAFGRWLKL